MGGPVIEILGNGGPMLPNPTRKCICIIHSNHRPPAPIDDSFDDVSNPDLAIALESHDTPFSHGFHHATRSPATERHCGAHGPDTSDQGDRLPHHVEAAAAARRSPGHPGHRQRPRHRPRAQPLARLLPLDVRARPRRRPGAADHRPLRRRLAEPRHGRHPRRQHPRPLAHGYPGRLRRLRLHPHLPPPAEVRHVVPERRHCPGRPGPVRVRDQRRRHHRGHQAGVDGIEEMNGRGRKRRDGRSFCSTAFLATPLFMQVYTGGIAPGSVRPPA